MSFLFRSLFQGGAGSAEPGPIQQPLATSHPGMMGATPSSHPLMQTSSPTFPPAAAASPFQMSGAPLFRTAGNEVVAAPPINSAAGMSPFNVQGATSTGSPLTVGDVIVQIPPEIARAGALPAEHPLSLPPALLENALRSGEPALPLFELYRVCPKLFQTPVSPQDPRLVKLPAAKLPGLIARTREGQGVEAAPAPVAAPVESPFAFVQQSAAAPVSQFQVAPPAPQPPENAASLLSSTPPMRPFAAASPFSLGGAADTPAANPFAPRQDAAPVVESPPSAAPSPFGMNGVPPASPAPQPPQSPASPFGMAQPFAPMPTAGSSPAPSAPTSNGVAPISLSGLFTPKAPENAAAAQMPPPVVMPPATPAISPMPAITPMASSTPSTQGTVKLGFAAILSGYSAEELGFNPAMIPAWMMTNIPAATLNEQLSSGGVTLELGALIDGLADVGFRNTLTSVKRGVQVRLPQNEVFHALTNVAPPQTPTPASYAPVFQPGVMAGQVSSVVSPQQPAVTPLFSSPQPMQHPLSAFAAPSNPVAETAPATQVPPGGTSLNPFEQPKQPDVAPPFSAMPMAQRPPAMVSPLPSAFSTPFGSPPPQTQSSPLAPQSKPFDPFAAASSPSADLLQPKAPLGTGFSSAQLLGQTTTPPASVSAAPTMSFGSVMPMAMEPKNTTPTFAPAPEEVFSAPAVSPVAAHDPLAMATSTPSAPTAIFSPPAASKPAQTAPPSTGATPAKHSFLGLSAVDTQTDQLLLRALLGTEEHLAAPRVVELLATQPGLSACVCLHGAHVLSHARSDKSDAAEFQRQAPEIAKQLRGLAPLIGIEGAETFTLNASGKLLTFCFPGNTIVAVLHDAEPSNGMRDKIILISRELARLLG